MYYVYNVIRYGMLEGCRHDTRMLFISTLLVRLLIFSLMIPIAGGVATTFIVFADKGYAMAGQLMVPFKGTYTHGHPRRRFNAVFSRLRIAVEWFFGKVDSLWKRPTLKTNVRILQNNVGMEYFAACFMTNIHTTFYQSQTGEYFGVMPPTFAEYVQYYGP